MRWEPFEINHWCSVATCVEFLEVFFFLHLKSITRKVYNPSMENPMGRFCQSMQGCWVWGLVSWLVGGDATPVKRTTTMLPEGANPGGTVEVEKGMPFPPADDDEMLKKYMWMFPKIRKWMVYFMENPIKMDDLGGKSPYFWKHPHVCTHACASAALDWWVIWGCLT